MVQAGLIALVLDHYVTRHHAKQLASTLTAATRLRALFTRHVTHTITVDTATRDRFAPAAGVRPLGARGGHPVA